MEPYADEFLSALLSKGADDISGWKLLSISEREKVYNVVYARRLNNELGLSSGMKKTMSLRYFSCVIDSALLVQSL
jgi:hypothetical protein